MVKKALILVGGAALLLTLFFGRDAVSYVGTSLSNLNSVVKDNVPIKFEIERARKMIKGLQPEIKRNMHLIAKEEVDVSRLQREVETLEGRLEKDRVGLMRLKSELEVDRSYYIIAGERYSDVQVKTDLANRFARYKTNDATLGKLRKVLAARESSLEAAHQKLEAMLAAKRQLEVDVENLEANLKMVEVAKTTSDFKFDDSRLSRTRSLIEDIQTRIEVESKLVNSGVDFHDEIPLDEPQSEDLTEQVDAYFAEEVESENEVILPSDV